MTAFIEALSGLLVSIALVLGAVFLLRMVKPLSCAIALVAERRAAQALASPVLQQLGKRIQKLLGKMGDP